jgi:hypothetical protein
MIWNKGEQTLSILRITYTLPNFTLIFGMDV